MTQNRRSEWIAVLFLMVAMFAACYGFAHSSNPRYLDQLSAVVHANLTFEGLAFAAFFAAFAAPVFLLLFDYTLLPPTWASLLKQVIYVVCGSPLLAYAFPAGILIIQQADNQIAGVIYGTVFASFVVIAYLAFKPRAAKNDLPTEN